MKNLRLVQLTLITAGALTAVIGMAILLMPDAFYASYGITGLRDYGARVCEPSK